MIAELKRFCAHAVWADNELLRAFEAAPSVPPAAFREFSHVIGAAETWLSRLEGRAARAAVWPTLSPAELSALAADVHAGYARYLEGLREPGLKAPVAYTNSAGLSFRNTVLEILMQAWLHGQYHRGKVNLLLRQSDLAPAPVDYIAFVRGVRAATHPPSDTSRS